MVASGNVPWPCSTCGRSFRNTNQRHSCAKVTADDHLAGRSDAVVATYRTLEAFLLGLPDVHVEAVKTRIQFKAPSAFATVQFKRAAITVSIALPVVPDDARFTAGEAYGDRRICWFDLVKSDGLDGTLSRALRQAYDLENKGGPSSVAVA